MFHILELVIIVSSIPQENLLHQKLPLSMLSIAPLNILAMKILSMILN